ncbi:MAG: hypothetical protein QOF21_2452, partial [Actinomycetota bacterium]
ILTPWLRGGAVERILERTPLHTANLDLIAELYPEARVVHIIRDGRDVARSLAAVRWGPGSAVDGAEEWVRSVTQGRRPMKHYHELRYEELLANPREEIVRLFDALELPVDSETVDAALREAAVPVNHDPSMPAVVAQKWRSGLSARDLAAVEHVCGELLTELGYELAAPPGSAPRPGLPGPSGILKAARRLVSERRKPEPPASPLDELTDAFEWAQRTVDLFVEHVRGGRMDMAAELLDPHVFVQVLMHDQEWSGRGTDVVEKLLALLAADPVLTRPQVRTDIHVALPAVTLVFASDTEDGFESRTLVLHVRARTIVRIAFYGLG